ncbi:MAG: SH3-like domain-containing protein [Methyloligellaceae bacterium]
MSGEQRFAPAEKVRVHGWTPPGHVRTPHYLRGQAGVIESVVGTFRNPEDLAYGRTDGAPVTLYRVSFASADLWPGAQTSDGDRLIADIYEHWLEPET